MPKLPNIPPKFLLSIQLNANNMFSVSFGSLEDLLNDDIWKNTTSALHEMLKKWVLAQAKKEFDNA